MMIDAFIFDLGNVLYAFDMDIAADYLKRQGIKLSLLTQLRLKNLLTNYELGKISSSELYEVVKKETGLKMDFDSFRFAFSNIFRENPDTVPLARRLLKQYPLYILSNTNPVHVEFLSERYPIMSEASGHVYSYEVGVAKPDPRIFEIVIGRFALNPPTTLYIDDIKENTDVAASLKFQTLHYPVKDGKPHLCLQDELTKLGVVV
jgi:putative hydrolase of the HAD superfamily